MSREAFEEWAKTITVQDLMNEPDRIRALFRGVAWAAWQAAESHTALRCWNICHEVTEALSAKSNIEDAYPDAFKEKSNG